MSVIHSAVILSAGLGTRMRPLTDNRPKPMVEILGKPLIAYVIEMLLGAGCTKIVMNIHYKPESLVAYVQTYYKDYVVMSDERDVLLDSGGGIVQALDNFTGEFFYVVNADCIWVSPHKNALLQMAEKFHPDMYDMMKLLCPAGEAIGFDGSNIYNLDSENYILRHQENPAYAFTGLQIMKRSQFLGEIIQPFSVRKIWDTSFASHRVGGTVFSGKWLHIGTPEAVGQAEDFLQSM